MMPLNEPLIIEIISRYQRGTTYFRKQTDLLSPRSELRAGVKLRQRVKRHLAQGVASYANIIKYDGFYPDEPTSLANFGSAFISLLGSGRWNAHSADMNSGRKHGWLHLSMWTHDQAEMLHGSCRIRLQ